MTLRAPAYLSNAAAPGAGVTLAELAAELDALGATVLEHGQRLAVLEAEPWSDGTRWSDGTGWRA